MYRALYDTSCFSDDIEIKSPTITLEVACLDSLDGRESGGLVDLVPLVTKRSLDFLNDFLNSERTWDILVKKFDESEELFINEVVFLRSLFFELLNITEKNFDSSIDNQKGLTIAFMISFSVVMLVVMMIGTKFMIKRVKMDDGRMKGVMKIIPLNLIVKNRWLKSYLLSSSGNVLDTIKI